jgi:hypothetical protein
MHQVLCEYEKVETHSIMKLTSSSYSVSVKVDTELVPQLSKLNWCLDTTKGEIYASDGSMEIPKLLGISCPRVYLWKYIVYLATGKVVKAWRGRVAQDYRTKVDGLVHGMYIVEAIA